MDKDAYLRWGIDSIYMIEKWSEKIKVVENMKMFQAYKKRFPFLKRIGMMISDALSIMSLATIRVK